MGVAGAGDVLEVRGEGTGGVDRAGWGGGWGGGVWGGVVWVWLGCVFVVGVVMGLLFGGVEGVGGGVVGG